MLRLRLQKNFRKLESLNFADLLSLYILPTGTRGGRRSNFVEVDRRCKYRPLMSFHDENDFVASTFYGHPKQLVRVRLFSFGLSH